MIEDEGKEPSSCCERQVGNFPQAFSHLILIGATAAISRAEADAKVAAA